MADNDQTPVVSQTTAEPYVPHTPLAQSTVLQASASPNTKSNRVENRS